MTNPGYGGENIRNLHDSMVDMQLGLSAYVTKTYPATSEAPSATNRMDRRPKCVMNG